MRPVVLGLVLLALASPARALQFFTSSGEPTQCSPGAGESARFQHVRPTADHP
jgi:hypothetical protein